MDKESSTGGGDRHENRDIKVGKVALIGVILLGIIGLAGHFIPLFVFKVLYKASDREGPPPSPLETTQSLPPSPRLQAHPQLDLRKLREAENNQLKSYSWVDRDNGTVRIPIDRAMELLAQRNAPPAGQPAAAAAAPGSGVQINPDSNSGRFSIGVAPARKQP